MRQAPCASSMKEIMFESIKNLEGGLVRHRYSETGNVPTSVHNRLSGSPKRDIQLEKTSGET
jgi:hypothetical protein